MSSEGPGLGLDGEPDLQRRRADAATARARRATQQAERAESRAATAEHCLAEIKASKAWRATWVLRRVSAALAARPRPYTGVQPPQAAAPPAPAPLALLYDNNWPRPERDAGSIEIVNLAKALRASGYAVHFTVDPGLCDMPAEDAATAQAALSTQGVTCVPHQDAPGFYAFMEREGPRYALVVLNRVYCGGNLFERTRTWCPGARIVFNTIDLHYVRIAREAAMTGNAALAAVAESTRVREETLAREADATFVVSDAERAMLETAVPGANVFALPLARQARPPRTRFAARAGIGFIGGFAHAPNLDAVRFFLDDVWPLVLQDWPDCRFSIVGAGLPPDLLSGQPGTVEYLGAVPDIDPWFESLLMTVAPLRFGAGIKGKVVSSLATGVPCVVTAIAAEGMGLHDGTEALLADGAADLARQVLRLHRDEALWSRLSAGGLAHIEAQFAPAAWRQRLRQALWTIDALPPEARNTDPPREPAERPLEGALSPAD